MSLLVNHLTHLTPCVSWGFGFSWQAWGCTPWGLWALAKEPVPAALPVPPDRSHCAPAARPGLPGDLGGSMAPTLPALVTSLEPAGGDPPGLSWALGSSVSSNNDFL